MRKSSLGMIGILAFVAVASCDRGERPRPASIVPTKDPYANPYPPLSLFKDDAKTNAQIAARELELTFVDSKGQPVDLRAYRGKKNVVLVVMRGYPGYVCPNCTAQTSRLLGNYKEFVKRDTEVVVVFPGPTDHLQEFVTRSQTEANIKAAPFPIVLDNDFKAVDRLGIRGDLAKPATFIVDKEGQVRFAYVGENSIDRPSLKAILNQLDAIPKS